MPDHRILVALAMSAALALSACSPPQPDPAPTASREPLPQPSASAPAFDPEATAQASKGLFDSAVRRVIRKDKKPGGAKIVTALVKAGFPAEAIEVTFDRTAIDLEADNIQFSVLQDGECILGQYGNVGYNSVVVPVLGSGRCMVGKTRPLDFL